MNIIILGPQGSGKGTQAKLLQKKFNFFYFEAGKFLRERAKTNQQIDEIVNKKGELLSDQLMTKLVVEYLKKNNSSFDNVLFDGFPRTTKQYKLFKKLLVEHKAQIDLVVLIDISEDEAIKRLSARRMDPKTGKIYNLVTAPKPGPEVDIKSLIHRGDDKPEAIRQRLSWYKSKVLPLVESMEKDRVSVVKVDGGRPIEVIHQDLVRLLEEKT